MMTDRKRQGVCLTYDQLKDILEKSFIIELKEEDHIVGVEVDRSTETISIIFEGCGERWMQGISPPVIRYRGDYILRAL